MSRRCCRRTTRPTGSTRSPTSWASRRCSSSATCRRPAASARWRSATWTSCPAPRPIRCARISRRTSTWTACRSAPSAASSRTHTFPVDGEYVLQATLYRTNVDQTRGLELPHQLEMTVDGERVFLETIGGTPPGNPGGADEAATGRGRLLSRSDAIDARLQVRVHVKAGPRTVTAAFLQRSRGADPRKLQPYRSSFDTYDASGDAAHRDAGREGPVQRRRGRARRPAGRACSPAGRHGGAGRAVRAADSLVAGAPRLPAAGLGRRTWTRTMEFYRTGREGRRLRVGHPAGPAAHPRQPEVRAPRRARSRRRCRPATAYRISDVELATRLSFFLWSSIPDDELLTLATRDRLRNPLVLEQQVRRMLRDRAVARARGQLRRPVAAAAQPAARHAGQRSLPASSTTTCATAFRREVELLFGAIMHEDRSVLELLTADYTFVDERLAKHYGIPNVYGSQFRRVPVTDEARKGLLGKGAVLAMTSNADRTSPVVRGKWILDNLQGMPPPSPPANVPPLDRTRRAPSRGRCASRWPTHRANAGLRQLPQADGPDRPGARELRRDRPLARPRTRLARSTPAAICSTARTWTASCSCARRCSSAPRCSSAR